MEWRGAGGGGGGACTVLKKNDRQYRVKRLHVICISSLDEVYQFVDEALLGL